MTRITNLEDDLSKDVDGNYRYQVLKVLEAQQQEIAMLLRNPASAKRYYELIVLRDANTAAARIIEVLWQRYRSN